MEDMVKIYTLNKEDETLLPLIEESFKTAGIEVQIKSNYDTAYNGLFIGQKGLADIFVLKTYEEKARGILEDLLKEN
jgi:hypothetical protein